MSFYYEIERYIGGDLQNEALVEMEAALEKDIELRQEYIFRKEVDASIKEDDVINLREQLDKITQPQHGKFGATENKIRFDKRKKFVAAASLSLLLGIGGIGYYQMNAPPSNVEVFEQYYEPYNATISFRSGNEELNSLLTKAYQFYQKEEYSKALSLFNRILDKKKDMAALLYSGISLMEIEKYREAEQSFEVVVEDQDNLFVEQAKWYMAMCYIKANKITEAEMLLEELARSSQFYHKRSKKALRDLAKLEED